MRGKETGQGSLYGYVSQEERIPADHPLRAMRQMVDGVLQRCPRAKTVGADKAFDQAFFVSEVRKYGIVPHVAQKEDPRYTAIDERTTRHTSYLISQRARKRIEECCGWIKTVAVMRKIRHRGLFRVGWMVTFVLAACNLVRMRNLLTPQPI